MAAIVPAPSAGLAFPGMDDSVRLALIVLLGIGFLTLLQWFPGHTARRRRHPNAGAINVGGWLWLVVCFLLWFGVPAELRSIRDLVLLIAWGVLVVWSFTGSEPLARPPPPRGVTVRQSSTRNRDEPVITDGPGRYRVSGVDRESRLDTTWHCVADSAANAKIKAELEGIIVSDVEWVGD